MPFFISTAPENMRQQPCLPALFPSNTSGVGASTPPLCLGNSFPDLCSLKLSSGRFFHSSYFSRPSSPRQLPLVLFSHHEVLSFLSSPTPLSYIRPMEDPFERWGEIRTEDDEGRQTSIFPLLRCRFIPLYVDLRSLPALFFFVGTCPPSGTE